MIETVIGIAVGGMLSWLLTHWYYRKAKTDAEAQDPIPLLMNLGSEIDGIKEKLSSGTPSPELDKELDSAVERMKLLLADLRHRIVNAYLPLDIIIQGILYAKDHGKWDALKELLDCVTEYRAIALKELLEGDTSEDEVSEAFKGIKRIAEQMDALDGHSAALHVHK